MKIADDYKAIAAKMKGVKEVCSECEGCGWIEQHSERPPSFRICPKCYNPNNLLCP